MTHSAKIFVKHGNYRLFLKRFLYGVVLIIYVVVIVNYWTDISQVISTHPLAVLYAVVLSLIAIAAQAFNFVDILNVKHEIPFLPTYRVWALSNLLNYVAPFQPGLVARSFYFRSKNISYLKFVLGTIRQMQLSFWTGIGLVVICLPDAFAASTRLKIIALSIFLAWLFIMMYIKRGKKLPFLSLEHTGKTRYLFSPPTLRQFILITIQYLLIASSYFVVLSELDIDISISISFLVAIGLVFSTIISLTPNNVGLQELIIGTVVYNITSTEAYTVVVPVIFRISHIFSCGIIIACLAALKQQVQTE